MKGPIKDGLLVLSAAVLLLSVAVLVIECGRGNGQYFRGPTVRVTHELANAARATFAIALIALGHSELVLYSNFDYEHR